MLQGQNRGVDGIEHSEVGAALSRTCRRVRSCHVPPAGVWILRLLSSAATARRHAGKLGEDRAQGLCALLCFGCSLETLRIGAAEAGDAVNVLGTESEEGPQAACQRSASMIMSGGW